MTYMVVYTPVQMMSMFLITFLVIILWRYLRAIPELECQVPISADGHALDRIQPEPYVKVLQRLIQLPEPEHEAADGICFCHPFGALSLQLLDPVLRLVIAFHQPVVSGKVIALIQRRGAVLIDAALGQLGHHVQLLKKLLHLPVDVGAIRELRLYHPAILNQVLPVRQELVVRFEELGLDEVFCQVRGAAFVFPLKLVIALPDHPAIFVRAVPDLRAEIMAAVAADQAAGKNGLAAVAPAQRLSPGHLFLHPVE